MRLYHDNTMPVVDLYMQGFLDVKDAIRRLLPQKLKDQVVFKIEHYAAYKNIGADEVINNLDELGLTDLVYDMYERYHQEAIENAFSDIDKLMIEKNY